MKVSDMDEMAPHEEREDDARLPRKQSNRSSSIKPYRILEWGHITGSSSLSADLDGLQISKS